MSRLDKFFLAWIPVMVATGIWCVVTQSEFGAVFMICSLGICLVLRQLRRP